MLTDSDNIRPTTTASVCQSILTIKKRRQTIVCCRCDSYRIQTCNLLIRSQMLYSVELMSHCRFGFAPAKLGLFFLPAKLFCLFFQALLPPPTIWQCLCLMVQSVSRLLFEISVPTAIVLNIPACSQYFPIGLLQRAEYKYS